MTNQPKQKTALQKVIEKLKRRTEGLKNPDARIANRMAILELKVYLPEERQAIIDAFNQGYREGENVGELMDMHDGDVSQFEDAEIYFNNKYESHV